MVGILAAPDYLRAEEKRTERAANYVHIALGVVFLILTLSLTGESPRRSLIVMFLCTGLTLGYGVVMSIVVWRGLYRRWQKFVSVSLDTFALSLMLWAIGSFRTFKSEAFLLYFVIVALACLRFSATLVLYSGLLSVGGFLLVALLAITGNQVTLGRMTEAFLTERVSIVNLSLRLVFLCLCFVVLTIVAKGYQRIIRRSVEGEKAEAALRREKQAIKDTLCRFVAQQVAEKILEDGVSLRGEKKLATILFSDIRGFTQLSASLDPADVVGFLNEYLSRMVDIIFEYGGTLDKFMGDGIMAVYGAPLGSRDDAERAVKTAVRMREALDEMNVERASRDLPPIRVGIGIHTGEVVAGSIGSMRRMDYTVVGSPVNLASRIEGLTKRLRADILISGETYERVKEIVVAEQQEPELLRGLSEAVTTYRVVQLREAAPGASSAASHS